MCLYIEGKEKAKEKEQCVPNRINREKILTLSNSKDNYSSHYQLVQSTLALSLCQSFANSQFLISCSSPIFNLPSQIFKVRSYFLFLISFHRFFCFGSFHFITLFHLSVSVHFFFSLVCFVSIGSTSDMKVEWVESLWLPSRSHWNVNQKMVFMSTEYDFFFLPFLFCWTVSFHSWFFFLYVLFKDYFPLWLRYFACFSRKTHLKQCF